jgi:adenylate kinase family enzyme
MKQLHQAIREGKSVTVEVVRAILDRELHQTKLVAILLDRFPRSFEQMTTFKDSVCFHAPYTFKYQA